MKFELCQLLLLLLLMMFSSPGENLQFDKNNGWYDIQVRIDDPSVANQYDERLRYLTKLQDSMAAASMLLYNATGDLYNNKRLQFHQIRVTVPQNWWTEFQNKKNDVGLPDWLNISRSASGSADFLIGHQSEDSVVQLKLKCGSGGGVAILSGSKMMENEKEIVSHRIFRQFVQLRYGIFPEDYAAAQFIDRHGNLRNSSCYERQSPDSSGVNVASSASIMWSHKAGKFCRNASTTSSKILQHNSATPNVHNRLCHGASTADVVMRHSDFHQSNFVQRWRPTQMILQSYEAVRNERKVAIIIDVSGSMGHPDRDRIEIAKSAAIRFIEQYLEDSVICSLVEFESSAVLKHHPVPLNSKSNRQSLSNAVRNLRARGGTHAAAGLDLGIQQLGYHINSMPSDATGNIVFICDGDTNFGNRIDLLSKTNIIVDTIGVGVGASDALTPLATSTGGVAYFTDTNDLSGFDAAFGSMVKTAADKDALIMLLNSQISSSFKQIELEIDESVTRNLTFNVQFLNGHLSHIRVTSPREVHFYRGSGSHIYNIENSAVTVNVPHHEIVPGQWIITNENPIANSILGVLSVNGRASTAANEYPQLLEAALSDAEVLSLTAETRISVTATLRRFDKLQRNAKLTALLTDKSGRKVEVEMRDDGIGADLQADDGIFSTFIPVSAISSPGKYSIKVSADKPVSRFVSVGILRISAVPSSLVTAAPGRVENLELKFRTDKEAELSWTAVGNELYYGSANSYNLLIANDSATLAKKWQKCEELPNCHVIRISSASTAGTQMRHELKLSRLSSAILPNADAVPFAAVVAQSSANVNSPLSNIIGISHRQQNRQLSSGSSTGLIVGILAAIAVVLIVVAVVAVVVVVVRQRNRRSGKAAGKKSGGNIYMEDAGAADRMI